MLALVTLLGELSTLSSQARELDECKRADDSSRFGWPVNGLLDARRRLYRRYSTSELRAEISKTAELMLEQQQWTWRLGQAVAFIVPTIGFAMALWNLRLEGNRVPYREIGIPLLFSICEVVPVVFLAHRTALAAELTLRRWQLFAEEMSVELPRAGLRHEPLEESVEGEKDRLDSQEHLPVSAPIPAIAKNEGTLLRQRVPRLPNGTAPLRHHQRHPRPLS